MLYKTLNLLVLLYDVKSLSGDAAAFRIFGRKVLRKIFSLVRVGDDFRLSELYDLLNDLDVVQSISIQWQR